MAEEILVNAGAMNNAASALNTHANTLHGLHENMNEAASRVRATWSAESQQQFDAAAAVQRNAIADIRACAAAAGSAVTQHGETTMAVDRRLANGFAAGGGGSRAT